MPLCVCVCVCVLIILIYGKQRLIQEGTEDRKYMGGIRKWPQAGFEPGSPWALGPTVASKATAPPPLPTTPQHFPLCQLCHSASPSVPATLQHPPPPLCVCQVPLIPIISDCRATSLRHSTTSQPIHRSNSAGYLYFDVVSVKMQGNNVRLLYLKGST